MSLIGGNTMRTNPPSERGQHNPLTYPRLPVQDGLDGLLRQGWIRPWLSLPGVRSSALSDRSFLSRHLLWSIEETLESDRDAWGPAWLEVLLALREVAKRSAHGKVVLPCTFQTKFGTKSLSLLVAELPYHPTPGANRGYLFALAPELSP